MISKIKIFISLVLLLVFVTSCGSKFSLQKRRYTKGFYFTSVKNKEAKKSEKIVNYCSDNKNKTADTVKEEAVIAVNAVKEINNEGIKAENKVIAESKSIEEPQISIDGREFEKNETVKQITGAEKASNKKTNKRGGLLDIIGNIYIGYLIIVLLITVGFLIYEAFQYYTLAQILPVAAVIILFVLLCYWVGSLVRRA